MNIFKPLCIFSEVNGVVLYEGKPVSGAVIERMFVWAWGNERGTDSTITDTEGVFRFPVILKKSISGNVIPHQPFIEQTITIQHEGKVYTAWMYDKYDYKENSELQKKPISITCRLENDPTQNDGVYGVCDIN